MSKQQQIESLYAEPPLKEPVSMEDIQNTLARYERFANQGVIAIHDEDDWILHSVEIGIIAAHLVTCVNTLLSDYE